MSTAESWTALPASLSHEHVVQGAALAHEHEGGWTAHSHVGAAAQAAPEPETEPEPELEPDAEAYGPHWPSMAELWAAQDAPWIANEAECDKAEFDRLMLAKQQTEAAYLEGVDRDLVRALEAEAEYLEAEAGVGEPELEADL